jgi:long-subunit fatty acid transport protein
LIDYTNNNVYARNVDFTYTTSQQRQSSRTKAGQYTWNLAYGANINDKVFLGIGGSMVITNYKNEKKYEEIIAPGTDVIKNFSYYENDYQRGTGFNANVGLIVKPTDFLRLGASFQTPTINYMREKYNYRIETNFDNYFYVPGSGNGFTVTKTDLSTPTYTYNYRYINPLKISGGASLIFGKLGLVTADIEYVPYTNASFKERGNTFALQGDNATVKNIYKDVINYKLGAEIRLADIYRIRGGFAYNASPYKTESIDRSTMYFTGGVGMRLTDYYIDFTVVQGRTSQIYQPYTVQSGNSPEVIQKKNYGLYQITTGIYF